MTVAASARAGAARFPAARAALPPRVVWFDCAGVRLPQLVS